MSEYKIKGRLLLLEHYLTEHTDEQHMLTTDELIEIYESNGYKANRNTIRDDIAVLIESDVDVVVGRKGKNKAYFIGSRLFEPAEVKTLVDAVSSSRFITAEKSEALIEKLSRLTSVYYREYLTNSAFSADRIKTDSPGIFVTIDVINSAISHGQKVSFQYVDYLPNKDEILRHKEKWYTVSPQAFLWNDDRYYVPSYSDEKGCIIPFRIDRMRHTKIIDEPAYMVKDFNPSEYSRKVLKMFDGDMDEQEVRLEALNKYMLNIIDRFGEEVDTEPIDDDKFSVKVSVRPSSTFFAWVVQFRGDVRITAPENVKKSYLKMLKNIIEGQ